MSATAGRLKDVIGAWRAMSSLLRPIRNEKQYAHAQRILDSLLDLGGGDRKHPLHGLLETLGELMFVYEERHHEIPDVSGREMIRYFMELHGLKQADLEEELGGQSAVSAILNGTRRLNVRQMRALGKRFGVRPSVFLDSETGD